MPKYTIIVPIYNMSKYLPCCINSLNRQTYSDFEVLLVDDCSTDDSFSICCKAATEDNRFRVLKQPKNSGLSSTRNLGIKNTKGKYLLFIDPDDYVEPGLLSMVEKVMTLEEVDIVTWGMFGNIVFPDGHEEIEEMSLNSTNDQTVLSPVKQDWEFFIQRLFFASTCNKVYQMKYIREKKLLFDPECVDFEDFIFNAAYLQNIKSFSVKHESFYHYRQKKGQIATIKRNWEKVKPFNVSDKVLKACMGLFEYLNCKGCAYDDIMLYSFKSYMSEVEYNFRTKSFGNFISTVSSLSQNQAFRKMLRYLNHPSLKKMVMMLRFYSRFHLGKLMALSLWMLNKRNLSKES